MPDEIINKVLTDSQPELTKLFWGKFAEEMEGDSTLEFMASVQMYAASCMRTALLAQSGPEMESDRN